MSVRQGNKVIAGGNSITVDQALDINSPNPIANSAVTAGLNGKQATITGAATTITSSDLSVARALVSDSNGKVAVSTVTSTELGYLQGTTSSVQTQINNKANTADLATVATSGSYNDLSDKPTIPDGDNSTITLNNNNKLQTVATINANNTVGATNPIYDWVGTLTEYQTQNIETLHPDWVCYITDDFSAQTYDAYSKGQSDNLFVTKGHQVIEFQEPASANGYTWYRKYADGWVEQGGFFVSPDSSGGFMTVNLPITMTDAHYTVLVTIKNEENNSTSFYINAGNLTTTSFQVKTGYSSDAYRYDFWWQASGMAA